MIGFYRLLVAFRATLSASRRAEQRENCLISHPGHVWWRLLSGRVDLAASSSHVLSQNQGPNEGPKIQFSSMDSTSPAKVRQHAPSPLSAGVLLHYAPLFATIIASISVYYRICVCVFTCPELNLKLFWSFIQSKPRILESFSQCDPITFDHVTDSLLRISPNSWTALRTVWGRDVVLKITMPLKRWRCIPSHSHPKKCAAAVLFEHSSLLKRIYFPHWRGTNLTAPASGHMFAGPL